MVYVGQLGGGEDFITQIIFTLMFFGFIFVYPRLMLFQSVQKLEKDAQELESLARKAGDTVAGAIEKRPGAKTKSGVRNFMEFFAVPPIDMDPYGIVRKLDMVIKQSDARFRWFVSQSAPRLDSVQQANVRNALEGAIVVHQVAKIVRHLLETIKKYKMFQLALIVQMQLPLIARIAKAAAAATDSFVDGVPIGDSIGPLVVASLVKPKTKVRVFAEEEFAVAPAILGGRKIFVSKAHGPGAGTGRPGKFLLKFARKARINRIITVDAALKLEGEKTGSIAEGVGVAMGGPGVDRYEIEEFAVRHEMPLDAVAIKQSDEEALGSMKPEVMHSMPAVIEAVKQALKRAKAGERILIMGVGNTVGVGNDAAAAKRAEELVKKAAQREAKKNKKE